MFLNFLKTSNKLKKLSLFYFKLESLTLTVYNFNVNFQFHMSSRADFYSCPVFSYIMLTSLLDHNSPSLFQKPKNFIDEKNETWFNGKSLSRYDLNKFFQTIGG